MVHWSLISCRANPFLAVSFSLQFGPSLSGHMACPPPLGPPFVSCTFMSCIFRKTQMVDQGGGHAIWPDNDGPNCNENDTARNGFARIENRVYISPKFGPSLELMSFVTPAVPLLFSSATYSRFHSCNYAFQRPLPREKMVQKACMCML